VARPPVSALARLFGRLFWWWGFWRARPRKYATREQLKQANEYARRYRATIARFMREAPYRREHHRDLLTGMVVALITGRRARPEPRPGEHLKRAKRRVGLRIRPANTVPENVYAVETRQCRRHGGWVKQTEAA